MISPTVDKRLSTGLVSMDMRLGNGLPEGSIIEIFGHKSSGRSAFATNCLAWAQRAGYAIALIDASDEFDPVRTSGFGINLDHLWYAQESSLEATLEATRVAVRQCKLTVLDCLASRPGEEEDLHSSHYINRRVISDKLRELAFSVKDSGNCLIVVNQSRQAIGALGNEAPRSYYGDLVRMYADRQIKLIEGPDAKDRHLKVGVYVYAKVLKTLGVQPYTKVKLRMDEHGFDYVGDILDLGLQLGILERRGSSVMFEADKTYNIGRSYKELLQTLDEQPDVWKMIETSVRRKTLGV